MGDWRTHPKLFDYVSVGMFALVMDASRVRGTHLGRNGTAFTGSSVARSASLRNHTLNQIKFRVE